jgi:hypothetical protein
LLIAAQSTAASTHRWIAGWLLDQDKKKGLTESL